MDPKQSNWRQCQENVFLLLYQSNTLFLGTLADFGPVTDAGFLFLFFSDAISFETENGNETPALIKQQGGVWTQTQQKKLDLGVNYLFIGISCRATY